MIQQSFVEKMEYTETEAKEFFERYYPYNSLEDMLAKAEELDDDNLDLRVFRHLLKRYYGRL